MAANKLAIIIIDRTKIFLEKISGKKNIQHNKKIRAT
jgi:hypothetical protein